MTTPTHDNPTLLCTPSWPWPLAEHIVPLSPNEYEVRQLDNGVWRVSIRRTGEWIYIGAGPVTITVSPAPF